MKIIVPLDFSSTSLEALRTGISIANKLKSDLRIVYVQPHAKHASGFESLDEKQPSVTQALDKLLLENRQSYYGGGKFDYKLREGNISQEIMGQAKYDDAAMIVMGSHGVSGITQNWLGGNAYAVVCHAPCPVLVIRDGMKYDPNFKRIVVPIELAKSSRYKIPVVGGVCKLFGASVVLIGMQYTGFKSILNRIVMSVNQVKKFLETRAGVTVEKTAVVKGNDVNAKFIEAAALEKADMVTIDVTRTSLFFKNRFRTFLISLVNKSECPVLAIPIKDN